MLPLEFLQTILQAMWRGAMNLLGLRRTKSVPPVLPCTDASGIRSIGRSLQSLANEVDRALRTPCSIRRMLAMSEAMRKTYRQNLQESEACMLPSFCHSMPNGQETGKFVALDVGGSTFRVALVELHGRSHANGGLAIHNIVSNKIDEPIRKLPGTQFFDWMAGCMRSMLQESKDVGLKDDIIPVGLTWSFPLEQTSHRSGKLQGMGKGFHCALDNLGMDLTQLLEDACRRKGLSIRVDAIINDGVATLLSEAYVEPSTSMALIVGTGTNAAVYLPVSTLGSQKFGSRDQTWFDKAKKVVVNTEVSMFGKDILPRSPWDEILNRQHSLPDFQPLEYMLTGRYLGEILRLIVFDAVKDCNLFNGIMPPMLLEPYTLDTAILAKLEEDRSTDLADSCSMIAKAFGLNLIPAKDEVSFLQLCARLISRRAAAYLAVAIHALWALQKEADINPATPFGTPKTSIACNGSVILKYPGFKGRCENYLARMIGEGASKNSVYRPEKIALEPTDEAAVFGAAVAVALAGGT